jgi:8-oxo-dGTP diphosphatase
MPTFGVATAVFQGNRILLTKRNDFEVWCLPGGAIEDGETLVEAAARETREETGIEVQITRFVGMYTQLRTHETFHLLTFAGHPIGGNLDPDPKEVVDIGYFERDGLPTPMLFGHGQQIADAWDGCVGTAYRYQVHIPPECQISRNDLYALRDRSGLSRQAFYLQMVQPIRLESDKRQIPPDP